MKMSPEGIKKLMEWEGTVLTPYKDAAGLPTIGTGHLIQKGEDYTKGLTEEGAAELLRRDLVRFEAAVNQYVTIPLSQNQFDALVSFAFNIGTGAFRSSTLLQKVNLGLMDEIPKQLMRWTKAGGKPCAGLVARRKNEIELWTA